MLSNPFDACQHPQLLLRLLLVYQVSFVIILRHKKVSDVLDAVLSFHDGRSSYQLSIKSRLCSVKQVIYFQPKQWRKQVARPLITPLLAAQLWDHLVPQGHH